MEIDGCGAARAEKPKSQPNIESVRVLWTKGQITEVGRLQFTKTRRGRDGEFFTKDKKGGAE